MRKRSFSPGWRKILVVTLVISLLLTALSGCSKDSEPATETLSPAATAGSADAYFRQGNDYFQQNNFGAAVEAFQQALALDPNNPAYHANLGVSYYSMGRLDEAIQSYQAGLKMSPDDAELNYLLGAAYLQQSNLDGAATALERANRSDPQLAEPYYGLGVLYKLQGRRAEAIDAFEKFLEIGPSQDQRAVDEAQRELDSLRSGQ